jgi:dihydrofolate reductase
VRKLIVCNNSSLDGYYEGPDNNVMALPMEQAFDGYYAERMRAADTVLLGATSYQGFLGFWPALADKPEATEDQKVVGQTYREIDKVVISDSLTPADIEPWAATTTIVKQADAAAHVAALKAESDGEILTFGSRTTWTALLRAGLVDELHLLVGAGVVGGGTPLFDGPVAGMSLVEHRGVGDNAVLLRYSLAAEG